MGFLFVGRVSANYTTKGRTKSNKNDNGKKDGKAPNCGICLVASGYIAFVGAATQRHSESSYG